MELRQLSLILLLGLPLASECFSVTGRTQRRSRSSVASRSPPLLGEAVEALTSLSGVPSLSSIDTTSSSSSDFENFLAGLENKHMLAYFTADWCQPCKQCLPELDTIARKVPPEVKIVLVDADTCGEVTDRYDITGLPTFLLLKTDGEVLFKKDGAYSAEEILREVSATLKGKKNH
uniref:Thioredoxin domain-containing protein n=1 Tax=Chromera velia CCMP2878 TaxID=1169474 RepID=A0A0G4HYJ6_9ALVE|mmetsp:Transcript_26310/g.51700  ORF Transcript_26310/g.51700 Transcript_26310/m.51700 type:complete len:176 (-) Transcript_26310:3308-3835(-)|eukprot:Cvel_1536.t1-p1 / transcript=Cvel_1536.t1 / gene=Cvel_1536 / organism=Chromera_velia_CCMP2878 / gene_product=Thioredoxin Y1, chloroplastic, putative / transcript_product=Thioredoxin Y1, chloroplastic, putative / location=Cvel_scaffold54:61521-62597(+) / protein_length=175 / sequence_SO=supercontig / SO=protein_coding / is_pseudo=false